MGGYGGSFAETKALGGKFCLGKSATLVFLFSEKSFRGSWTINCEGTSQSAQETKLERLTQKRYRERSSGEHSFVVRKDRLAFDIPVSWGCAIEIRIIHR